MGARGRKPASELTVAGRVAIIPRADTPHELTDEQAVEWEAIVNRMPADWFPRETHACLIQYCREVVVARRIAELMESALDSPEFDVTMMDKLHKMQERASRVILSAATKLRITPQSLYDPKKKRGNQIKAPWESG